MCKAMPDCGDDLWLSLCRAMPDCGDDMWVSQ